MRNVNLGYPEAGRTHNYVNCSIATDATLAGNPASRGIVFGSYGPGQPGHVFNVVNQNGTVHYLDGQAGKSANMSNFKTLLLLITN
ncbi:toxin glutamine deamidase domain-containing protein [Pseudomonas cichorii]|uniref:toxin glutamine deamidase domain-containing protein n=1 Tax=Pseudomonas cichorii TaxID=36746 RepID=UPI000F00F322